MGGLGSGLIYDHGDLADYLGVDRVDQIAKAIYRATNCGASITLESNIEDCYPDGPGFQYDSAVVLGSIVEGTDWECYQIRLTYPFAEDAFEHAIEEIESQAKYIWNQTHGCDRCEEDGWIGETGEPAIDPNCPACKGEGQII